MPIHRARSPNALYDAVADYDVVLVPDNPLADAINRRVEAPQFGTFATTPRRLATRRREDADDRQVFLDVIDRTDHDWKAVGRAIETVLDCWKHRGDPEAIFDFDAFADGAIRPVVERVAELATASSRVSGTVVDGQSVAVVGYEQFTARDRSVLPDEYDRVDLFTDDSFELPRFHVFESSAHVVDAVVDTVTPEHAEDVAVVLDSGSRYSSLVESAFDAAGIPYYGGPGFVDDPHHRTFIGLLRAAHRGSDTTVAEVASICSGLDVDVATEHAEKRIGEVDDPDLAWVADFCAGANTATFAEAIDGYETRAGRSLESFRDELRTLGLLERRVDRHRVDDLTYYLRTYEVPVEREDEGVLLADAKSSGYVDRPVVFYLGLDDGWTHSAPRRPWVNAEAQFERYIRQFQLLLQSGSKQYYLVQDAAGGQPVTPCQYLTELLDRDVERFSDLDSTRYTRPAGDGARGFHKEQVDARPETIDTLSQSSLNTYVNSPREYFFSRLLETPDRDFFREGNLFHDFAEFYVNHPETIDDAAIEAVVDVFLDEAGAFFHDDEGPLRRRKYRIGLENIVEFLDANRPEREGFLTPTSGWGTNRFADYFGEPIDTPLTERWFENGALGCKGKIDLVRAPDHLVDYKSGHKKPAYSVVKGSTVDPPDDTPNFQAALYLSYFRTVQPNTRIEFTFFHFLDILDDVIAGDGDLENAMTTVTYHPEPFDEFVGSREAYGRLLDGYSDCVATFEELGFEDYAAIMDGLAFPETTDRDELRESAFAREFANEVDAATADSVDAETGCDQAIRELNGVRKRAFFRDDLDAFEEFLADRIDEINRYRTGVDRFPVDGPGGEPNYRRVDHRDLLLEEPYRD